MTGSRKSARLRARVRGSTPDAAMTHFTPFILKLPRQPSWPRVERTLLLPINALLIEKSKLFEYAAL